MKTTKSLIIVCSLLFSISTLAQKGNLRALDEKYGFKSAIFEMPLSSFNNLEFIEEGHNTKVYSCNDDLKLGDFDLFNVSYFFYKERLSAVSISTKGLINSRGVLKVLQSAYGNGYKDNPYIEDYFWNGAKVIMTYEEDIDNNAAIWIISNILRKEQMEDEKKSADDAVKDL